MVFEPPCCLRSWRRCRARQHVAPGGSLAATRPARDSEHTVAASARPGRGTKRQSAGASLSAWCRHLCATRSALPPAVNAPALRVEPRTEHRVRGPEHFALGTSCSAPALGAWWPVAEYLVLRRKRCELGARHLALSTEHLVLSHERVEPGTQPPGPSTQLSAPGT
jgi:hypothetical protein